MRKLLKTQARPYARAAYEVALLTHHLKDWQRFLQNAVSMTQHEDVLRLLQNRFVSVKQRRDLFFDILKKDFFDEYCQNFLMILIEARRLFLLQEITALFSVFEQESRQVVKAKVVSAIKLSGAECKKLEELLGKRFQKKMYLDCEVDSGMIAGIVVKVNDFVIDCSMKNLLNQLRDYLKM